MENKTKFHTLLEWLEMTFGSLLIAVGVYFFKVPNGFSLGGVSGISTLLGKVITWSWVTPGMLMFGLNVILLIIGFVVIGKDTGIRTAYCSLAYSGMTWILERTVKLEQPMTDQPFLELVYAILLTGIGSAIMFHCRASSGGTDIVALILKKYTSLDVGKALLCSDSLISAGAFLVFGLKAGLFSMLGLFAKAFLIDGVIENLNVCKSFMIITAHPKAVVAYILNVMHHSATTLDACGEYTHQELKAVITVCRRAEAVRLRRFLKETDPTAFVIVESTSEIIGRGFRQP